MSNEIIYDDETGLPVHPESTITIRIYDYQSKLDEISRLSCENSRLTKIILTETDKFTEPPCCICGYNGRGYYQPSVHPCAAIWHERV